MTRQFAVYNCLALVVCDGLSWSRLPAAVLFLLTGCLGIAGLVFFGARRPKGAATSAALRSFVLWNSFGSVVLLLVGYVVLLLTGMPEEHAWRVPLADILLAYLAGGVLAKSVIDVAECRTR